jgi:adenine phosphoribosyltransferase
VTSINLAERVRSVPDFPVKGILFRDITPLLNDPAAFDQAVAEMSRPWHGRGIELIAAMEARGFIFGAGMALRLDAGFVPIRKAGKLPWKTRSAEYTLEYRSDVLHIHEDAIRTGQKVLVVDDVIATGGTARAVVELVEALGGKVEGIEFLIELVDLGGRKLLEGYEVHSVISFEGD